MVRWAIGDPHFGHFNILAYCDRPFADLDEMHEVIMHNWNTTVDDEDLVIIFGDLAFGKGSKEVLKSILPQLKGHKRLIRGNHDHETITWYKRYGIEHIYGPQIWDEKWPYRVILSHIPVPCKAPCINIHAHVHNLIHIAEEGIYRCVSVEQINYTPVDLDKLIKEIRDGN